MEDDIKIKFPPRMPIDVEKEGVYNQPSERRIFDQSPCILVMGKGSSDLTTRALVNTLHRELG